MTILHKELAASGRWFKFSLIDQLANVGTDIERAINWKKRGETENSKMAFARAMDLLDLTIADPKNKKQLKEMLLTREALLDYFVGDNQYASSDELWYNYFYAFGYASAIQRGR